MNTSDSNAQESIAGAVATNDPPQSAHDYTTRRGELSAFGRATNSARTLRTITIAIGLALVVLVCAAFLITAATAQDQTRMLLWLVLAVALFGLALIWRFVRQHFIEPDLALRKWLQQVCDGSLDARVDLPETHRHYKELDFHTRNLASALAQMSNDMASLVETQTERLKNQGSVLEMLLQLSEDVATESDKTVVLTSVTQHLAIWFGDALVSGYLLEENSWQKVACAESGELGMPANALVDKDSLVSSPATVVVEKVTWDKPAQLQGIARVRVPFFCSNKLSGLVVLYIRSSGSIDKTAAARVLLAVSEQLTLFNNKQSAREQAEQARLIGERARLAADVHDSLAQTLLAARYKASLLEEELVEANKKNWSADIRKITAALGEANQEIRDLIREYRSPLADHRSIDEIQKAIEHFRNSSEQQVFFQCENPQLRFTPREESVVQRIIGEALNNADKYANANTIRVFLGSFSDGTRTVLIEDDGQGFDVESMLNNTGRSGVESGEHIGLSIMQERAVSIGAILTLDSEPGEGTRVSLRLPPLLDSAM